MLSPRPSQSKAAKAERCEPVMWSTLGVATLFMTVVVFATLQSPTTSRNLDQQAQVTPAAYKSGDSVCTSSSLSVRATPSDTAMELFRTSDGEQLRVISSEAFHSSSSSSANSGLSLFSSPAPVQWLSVYGRGKSGYVADHSVSACGGDRVDGLFSPHELDAVARAVWAETGSDTASGRGLAHVIANRARDPARRWPSSYAGVVAQPYQFPRAWQPERRAASLAVREHTDPEFAQLLEITRAALSSSSSSSSSGTEAVDPTAGATFFFPANEAKPAWAAEFAHTATIGSLAFYKS